MLGLLRVHRYKMGLTKSTHFFLGSIAITIGIGISINSLLAPVSTTLASEINPASEASADDELSSESSDYSPSPVNGVSFQTVIDNPVLQIPEPGTDQSTPVRFGLQLTNNTEEVIRFGLMVYPNISLQIFQSDSVRISQGIGSDRPIVMGEECPFVLQAGETQTLWVQAAVFWDGENLRMHESSWVNLEHLTVGEYFAQFYYDSSVPIPFCFMPDTQSSEPFSDLWRGKVITNSVPFSLINP
ncbi:MAG: hypothetical protein AAGG51_08140 [Cyanobacteria bacterium P01_G01_bin.54]